MSVLIKGMEMPKNCKKCMFADFDDVEFDYELYCAVSKKYADLDARDRPLGWACPLTEVKEPHDDLVDRGWVRDSINYSCWVEYNDYLEAIGIVDDAPTIVEAEGREG